MLQRMIHCYNTTKKNEKDAIAELSFSFNVSPLADFFSQVAADGWWGAGGYPFLIILFYG